MSAVIHIIAPTPILIFKVIIPAGVLTSRCPRMEKRRRTVVVGHATGQDGPGARCDDHDEVEGEAVKWRTTTNILVKWGRPQKRNEKRHRPPSRPHGHDPRTSRGYEAMVVVEIFELVFDG